MSKMSDNMEMVAVIQSTLEDSPRTVAMVEVKKGELFGKVDCVDQTYQQGLYYDGMPCLNVSSFLKSKLPSRPALIP